MANNVSNLFPTKRQSVWWSLVNKKMFRFLLFFFLFHIKKIRLSFEELTRQFCKTFSRTSAAAWTATMARQRQQIKQRKKGRTTKTTTTAITYLQKLQLERTERFCFDPWKARNKHAAKRQIWKPDAWNTLRGLVLKLNENLTERKRKKKKAGKIGRTHLLGGQARCS